MFDHMDKSEYHYFHTDGDFEVELPPKEDRSPKRGSRGGKKRGGGKGKNSKGDSLLRPTF